MTFNAELARKALDHIKTHPAEWVQSRWRCETGMCFAGHVAFQSGEVEGWYSGLGPKVETVDGGVEWVEDLAASLLGFPHAYPEAADLFAGDNTIADLERLIDEYAA